MAAVRSLYVARQTAPGLYPWYARQGEVMVDELQDQHPRGQPGVEAVRQPNIADRDGRRRAGQRVRSTRYGGANGLIIGGYANGCTCYLPSNELLPPIKTGGSYEGGWKTDHPGIAGESMTVYGQIAHCKAGSAGTEGCA